MKKFTIKELRFLRDLYANNAPKYVPMVGLLNHFTDRFEKHPKWVDKVQFLTIDESTLKSGTFVMHYAMIDAACISFNSLEAAPYRNLEHLLNSLSYSKEKFYEFWTVSEEFLVLIENLLRAKNFEKLADNSAECHEFKMDHDKLLKLLENATAPDGFYYDSLKQSDVPKIKSTAIYKIPIGYLETVIEYNPTTALYTNDGELIAWAILHETGESGMLEVDDKYKRRGFGRDIVLRQTLKLKNEGRLLFRFIFDGNNVAHNFSKNVNMKVSDGTAIGKFSYITVKPRVNQNSIKFKL